MSKYAARCFNACQPRQSWRSVLHRLLLAALWLGCLAPGRLDAAAPPIAIPPELNNVTRMWSDGANLLFVETFDTLWLLSRNAPPQRLDQPYDAHFKQLSGVGRGDDVVLMFLSTSFDKLWRFSFREQRWERAVVPPGRHYDGSLALAPSGDIYYSDGLTSLYVWPKGGEWQRFPFPAFMGAEGKSLPTEDQPVPSRDARGFAHLAVGPSNELYLVDWEARIVVFAQGQFSWVAEKPAWPREEISRIDPRGGGVQYSALGPTLWLPTREHALTARDLKTGQVSEHALPPLVDSISIEFAHQVMWRPEGPDHDLRLVFNINPIAIFTNRFLNSLWG